MYIFLGKKTHRWHCTCQFFPLNNKTKEFKVFSKMMDFSTTILFNMVASAVSHSSVCHLIPNRTASRLMFQNLETLYIKPNHYIALNL